VERRGGGTGEMCVGFLPWRTQDFFLACVGGFNKFG